MATKQPADWYFKASTEELLKRLNVQAATETGQVTQFAKGQDWDAEAQFIRLVLDVRNAENNLEISSSLVTYTKQLRTVTGLLVAVTLLTAVIQIACSTCVR